MTGEVIDERRLAEQLLGEADPRREPRRPGGLLASLTRQVLETALEEELTEHLGHEYGGTSIGPNERNGTREKTVFTEIGPVTIEIPRDRADTFDPVIVPKRKRRLGGIDDLVLSLSARGLTTGEIAAHFGDVYGATVSQETIGRISEKVAAEMPDGHPARWTASTR